MGDGGKELSSEAEVAGVVVGGGVGPRRGSFIPHTFVEHRLRCGHGFRSLGYAHDQTKPPCLVRCAF